MKPSISQKLTYGCLAFAVLLGAAPAHAQEPPASVTFEVIDVATGMALPSLGGLKAGQQVSFRLNARDRMGRTTQCTPNVQATGGHSPVRQGDGSYLMTVANTFGSAELIASCAENPSLVHKEFMAVSTPLGGPRPATAASRAQAPMASPARNTGLIVGVVAGGAVLAGLAVAAAGATEDVASSSSCPTLSQCCPGGSGGGCGAPSSCNCPSGTTNQGICTSGGCVQFVGAGNRSCTCN